MTSSTQDAAMSARRHVASRTGISFLHRAGGEDTLLLDKNRAGLVAALLVRPDS